MSSAGSLRVASVDATRLVLEADSTADFEDAAVDVHFGGQRVWSLWLVRDSAETDGSAGVRRTISWPMALRRFLKGATDLTLVRHLDGVTLIEEPIDFGGGGAVSVKDGAGRPLAMDKSGRVVIMFDTRGPDMVEPLLDAVEQVLAALKDAGVEAFPAYGTLLGAVREGQLIGHDSDADLGYVSHYQTPVDVILESFRLQRRLERAGFPTHRYSSGAIKVDVREPDGSVRGLDVFAGFMTNDHLYLMGEVGVPFKREWMFPLGTTTLEGRTLPAPARPEKLLEAMYGENWRIPDPAFSFETSEATTQKLSGWFRGLRAQHHFWLRRYSTLRNKLPQEEASDLAHTLAATAQPGAHVIDVGAGRGQDALFLARKGFAVTALDLTVGASLAVQSVATKESLPVVVRRLNLNSSRSWLANGAWLARSPGPRVVLARHIADALIPRSRAALWRMCEMALREGGELYVEFLRRTPGQAATLTRDQLTPLDTDTVIAELTARKAVIVDVEEGVETPVLPASGSTQPRPVTRLRATWNPEQVAQAAGADIEGVTTR